MRLNLDTPGALTPEEWKERTLSSSIKGNKVKQENVRLRNLYCQKVINGDLPFHQLVEMSQDPALKPLKYIKILKLLASFPGWTKESAKYAFLANNLSDALTVKDCRDKRKQIIISKLMDSSASSWKQRVPAPPGWPWYGNLADVLADFKDEDLPKPLREVRYEFGGELNPSTTDDDMTAEEKADLITDVLGGKRPTVNDGLDDLFADEEEDDEPEDNLDDLFADDDDDGEYGTMNESGSSLTSEEINKMLGL